MTGGRVSRSLVFGPALVFAVLLTPAQADQPPPPDAAEQQPAEIEQVVVTARRLSENLEAVPIAITALSGETLQRDTVQTAYDLQQHVPSLQIDVDGLNGSGQPNFTIRGLGRVLGTDPTVVTYFAEVPQSGRGLVESIYDMSDIQVLRGPQGVAFGKNSTGGDVLFTPQRPTDQLGGSIQGQWGNYGDQDYTGILNIPVDGHPGDPVRRRSGAARRHHAQHRRPRSRRPQSSIGPACRSTGSRHRISRTTPSSTASARTSTTRRRSWSASARARASSLPVSSRRAPAISRSHPACPSSRRAPPICRRRWPRPMRWVRAPSTFRRRSWPRAMSTACPIPARSS